MREKLIELIGKAHNATTDACFEKDLTYAEAREIEADVLIANGVTIQKWIPVTERLPKHGDVVLVHGVRGGIYTAEFRMYSDFGGEYPHWHKLNSKSHYCVATHWMPLPELPKGSDEDGSVHIHD